MFGTQKTATFDPPDCLPRTAIVLLTYLLSPRLPVAFGTWMRDAAFISFDIVLMVSATQQETDTFNKLHTLPLHVSIANTWTLLRRNDTPYVERWKTHAFYGTLLEPKKYDWYVMLDDDTLPNLASLARILCILNGGDKTNSTRLAFDHQGNVNGGLYMGWTPESNEGYVFATGQGFLMDQKGVETLKHRMLHLPRVKSRESCHSVTTLARMPRWWAACCAVDDGFVRSFDYFIGTCLATTNVSLVSIGDSKSGWWARLFHHGGELKRPNILKRYATLTRKKGWGAWV
jgi:hypothetical protein